jgi:hypothetical protein
MAQTSLRCGHCYGEHELDPPDCWVGFEGYRFFPPFLCMCCGRETCARQFAYGRTCGLCDTGACNPASQSYKLEYAHEHPSWWEPEPACAVVSSSPNGPWQTRRERGWQRYLLATRNEKSPKPQEAHDD